jgi:hypothetical protein
MIRTRQSKQLRGKPPTVATSPIMNIKITLLYANIDKCEAVILLKMIRNELLVKEKCMPSFVSKHG